MKIPNLVKWPLLAIVILFVVLLALVYVQQESIPPPGTATGTSSRVYNEAWSEPIQSVGKELDAYRASLVSPSISVAVAVGGELIWADARGYSDIESQTLATPDTVYAIASVSKPITAVLATVLWQKGVLDIDQDVRSYVPGFPAKEYAFTLRQLLSHQAGIRHYRFEFKPPTFSEAALNREFSSTAESLTLFANDPLEFEPDTDFNYSTYGYTLISAAIENATGQTFIGALEQFLLNPLDMRMTSIDRAGLIPGMRATDYVGTFSKKAVLQPPATNSSYKWAGGGLVSTPSDLARFGSALLDNLLLNDATRKAMFTARTLTNGDINPQHYGLGWRIGGLSMTNEETGEEKIISLMHHGGTRSGSTAILMIVADYGIVVAMTSNSVGRGGSGPLTSVAAKVARQFIRFEESQNHD